MSANYVSNALSSSGLANLEEEALEDIQLSFTIPTTYGILNEELFSVRYRIETQNPTALFLRDIRTGGGRFLDAPQRIFLIEHQNWIANQRLTGLPNLRGRYLYEPAAILLHQYEYGWCRKTLVHEILHGISLYSRIFSRFPDLIPKHLLLIEGITECLVGYILLKRHCECYEGWKMSKLDRCSISYRGSVKLWCSFCQCVGIRDLAEFYLSQQDNLTVPWGQLVQSVHAKGFTKFNYQLDPGRAFNEPQFREVCIKSFPAFRNIYESPTRCFDFSHIP